MAVIQIIVSGGILHPTLQVGYPAVKATLAESAEIRPYIDSKEYPLTRW